jgi:hypothetical protein
MMELINKKLPAEAESWTLCEAVLAKKLIG